MAASDDLSEQEIREIVRDELADPQTGRRSVLKALGLAGGAAALGAGVTQPAAGAASTTDSDGNVGTPTSRVDVFSDGVSAKDVNNVVYAKDQSGTDLQAKVANAASALQGGQGRIRVTAKDDGTNWSWGSTWTVDPTNYEGIHLDIDDTVGIDDSTTGYAISVEPASVGDQLDGSTFKLTGGRWFATASDPDGWVKGVDAYHVELEPRMVQDYKNTNGNSTAITAENVDQFSESWIIAGQYNQIDIGVDFRPASVTGGTGTDSFDDWVLDNPIFNQVKNIGIRARGGCRFQKWDSPAVFPGADNAVAYRLDGGLSGTTITSAKADEVNTNTGTIAVETGSNYDSGNAPIFIAPRFSVDTDISRNQTDDQIPAIRLPANAPANGAIQIGDYGRGSLVVSRTGGVSAFDGTQNRVIQTDSAGHVQSGLDFFSTGAAVEMSDGAAATGGGPNGTGELSFGNTRIYENSSGEIVAEDSAGNTTTIS